MPNGKSEKTPVVPTQLDSPMQGRAERVPAHGSITPEQVSLLVDQFYNRVRADERLAPIFAAHMSAGWDDHLPKMKAFWRSVLLKTGEYKGKPVPAHAKMADVGTEDFSRWLTLFGATVREIFEPDAQPPIMQAAERIATSLWLVTNPSPFANPPHWPDLVAASAAHTKGV